MNYLKMMLSKEKSLDKILEQYYKSKEYKLWREEISKAYDQLVFCALNKETKEVK